jgi:hypothetical protein
VVIAQVDLNFDNEYNLPDPRSWDAFPDYADALRDAALAFDGQVAYVRGDAHYYKQDKRQHRSAVVTELARCGVPRGRRTVAPIHSANILPGFMMPRGSSAAFSERIKPTATGG